MKKILALSLVTSSIFSMQLDRTFSKPISKNTTPIVLTAITTTPRFIPEPTCVSGLVIPVLVTAAVITIHNRGIEGTISDIKAAPESVATYFGYKKA